MYCPCGLVTLSPRICANHLCRDNLLLCHSRQSPASPETFAFGSREKLYCKLPTLNQHIDGISTQRAYDSKLTKKNPLPSIPIELNIVFVFVCLVFLTCTAGLCLAPVKKKRPSGSYFSMARLRGYTLSSCGQNAVVPRAKYIAFSI